MSTKAPNSTAATEPTTASVSIAFTVGLMLQPANSTTAVSPMHSATTAAKTMRRAGGIRQPLIARAITSRWISFVPS